MEDKRPASGSGLKAPVIPPDAAPKLSTSEDQKKEITSPVVGVDRPRKYRYVYFNLEKYSPQAKKKRRKELEAKLRPGYKRQPYPKNNNLPGGPTSPVS